MKPLCSLLVLLCSFSLLASAVEDDETALSRSQRALLVRATEALQAEDPASCLQLLQEWPAPDHVERRVLEGRAQVAAGRIAAGRRAFEAALALDAEHRPAGLGLISVLQEQEDWGAMLPLLGRFVDPNSASSREVLVYAHAAWLTGDRALARLIVERGRLRFPAEDGFRRLALDLALATEDWQEAGTLIRDALQRDPADAAAWSKLAAVAQQQGKVVQTRSALELALLSRPEDRELRRQFTQAQLAAGHAVTAWRAVQPLLASEVSDADRALAARIALAKQDAGRAVALLQAIEAPSREQGLLLARAALQADDLASGLTALDELIAAGEQDPQVLLWAATLCERGDQAARAEALYRRVAQASTEEQWATQAQLLLARLFLRQGRNKEARALLTSYLQKRPQDRHAQAMLAIALRQL